MRGGFFTTVPPVKTPEGTYFNIIKAIYNRSTYDIIFNGEKLKALPPRSGTRQISFPQEQSSPSTIK